jgi:hypothetical protein
LSASSPLPAPGAAAAFISGINGCYYNVMGLPLHKFCAELSRLGFEGLGRGRGRGRGRGM